MVREGIPSPTSKCKTTMKQKSKSKILNGTALADKILREVRQEIVEQKLAPSLAVILVGNDPASKTYIKLKKRAAQKCGLEFYLYQIAEDASEKKITDCLNFLNNDPEINAIIVQLPLPKHLDEDKIIAQINPKKDADGFHPENLKLLLADKPYITPGLCQGIIRLIKEINEDLTNKRILVISNNKIFAQPLSYLISKELCKFGKKCSSVWSSPKDKNLKHKTTQADIIIIAIGQPKFLKSNMIKKDAIIIDVGYNQIKGRSKGDVDFTSCSKKAGWLSPVPGGVGPMTVAMLLKNTLELHNKQKTR